jgi:hypothetical protein
MEAAVARPTENNGKVAGWPIMVPCQPSPPPASTTSYSRWLGGGGASELFIPPAVVWIILAPPPSCRDQIRVAITWSWRLGAGGDHVMRGAI